MSCFNAPNVGSDKWRYVQRILQIPQLFVFSSAVVVVAAATVAITATTITTAIAIIVVAVNTNKNNDKIYNKKIKTTIANKITKNKISIAVTEAAAPAATKSMPTLTQLNNFVI